MSNFVDGQKYAEYRILPVLLDRIKACHAELERGAAKEKKLSDDNRQLADRISTLEKQYASVTLELKAVQNSYQQELKSRESNEKSRIVSKEEANLEAVKGNETCSVLLFPSKTFESSWCGG